MHHEHSARVFRDAKGSGYCALRTLGEVYATLTGLPIRPRISGKEGLFIIRQILDRLEPVSLSTSEYIAALESQPAIVGSAAYDALIGHCAMKAAADVLVTWNVRDFLRLGTEIAQIVRTPREL